MICALAAAPLYRVCAWCPPALVKAEEAEASRQGRPVTHGICPACLEGMRRQIKADETLRRGRAN